MEAIGCCGNGPKRPVKNQNEEEDCYSDKQKTLIKKI